uniref:Uncharacterized protein n=1 Tax=Aliarcobacter butzleri TaxID=28197 RepID=W0LVT8_9BACT|nr:hypothetical protein [Aliarcobacter butzleri]AHG28733.1 hypothetical protein [Aliarcobacter butzleri]
MSELYHNNGDFKITNGLNHQNFSYLTIRVENHDYSAWVEHNLPTPTIINHTKYGYVLSWALNGYFANKNAKQYLIDTTNKILALIPNSSIYEFEPFKTQYSFICEMIYHLADFRNIVDKRTKIKRKFKKHNTGLMAKDEIFEMARFQCYDLKLQGRLSYEAVYDIFYTLNNKYNLGKEDDIKYKAKNVYTWVKDKYNPKFFTEEEHKHAKRKSNRKHYIKKNNLKDKREDELMTRNENAKLQAKKKVDENIELCKEALITLNFMKIKITAVSLGEQVNLTRQTAGRYLKMILEEEKRKKEKDINYKSVYFINL